MKRQLFYRSPDINGNEGGNDEQPVDETSTDSGEETNSEDGATDEDNTSGEETSSEDGATDENTTSDEETNSEDGATAEDNTSGEETGSEDGATDENTTSGEETSSEDGATDEDNTNIADENSSEDGSTDGNNTEEGQTSSSEEETPEEGNTEEGQTSSSEEEQPKEENTEEGQTSSSEEETPEEGNTEEGQTSSSEEEQPKEENTEEGQTSSSEEEQPKEENTEEGQTSSSEEETPKENNNEEKEPLVEEEFPKNNGGQQSSNGEETPKENNTVSTPPVAVVWPGSISQSPVASPGDELAVFITAIKANRVSVPEYITDKNKYKAGYMYDPFAGKPQPQPASIQPNTVDAWIWEELRSEGSYTSINTWDNMVVTWGKGVAGSNISKVLKSVFSAHSDIQTEFNNIGIALNANGILQVVDTNQNCVKEAAFALQTIKADRKLLDFLVDISLNNKYKDIFLNAQWGFAKTFNAGLITYVTASNWSKDAVQLILHFNWWAPAYAWGGHSQNYKDTGGNAHKIIYLFAGYLNKNSVLVGYLKKFAGNAFSKYVAKAEYETQPVGEHIVFEDAGKTYYFPKL